MRTKLRIYRPDHACGRHVALLKIQGKEFELTPLPLRSVRPFVIDEVNLSEVAEENGFDLSDKIEIGKFLKNRVCHIQDRYNSMLTGS